MLALSAMALAMGGQFAMFVVMSLYYENELTYSATATGLAFLPMSLSFLAVSSFAPRLVARFGAPRLIAIGTVLLAASLFMFSRFDADTNYVPHGLLTWLLDGAAIGLIIMPGTSVAMDRVREEHMGSASGFLQTVQGLGSAAGVAVVMSVFAVSTARSGLFLPSAHAALVTAGSLALAGFVAAVVLVGLASGTRPAPDA